MRSFDKLAAVGAFVVFLAFLMHNVNAIVIEPNMLGFRDPAVDYAKVEKLHSAMLSVPWAMSGLGHFLTGFAVVALGFAAHARFVERHAVAARLALGSALLAASGFILTGVSNLGGVQALRLLLEQNSNQAEAIILAASIVRISFNSLAIVSLGWFALQLSWCGLRSGLLPRGFCYFGFLAAASGLVMAFAYVPVYLVIYLIWSLWMSITFWRLLNRDALRAPV